MSSVPVAAATTSLIRSLINDWLNYKDCYLACAAGDMLYNPLTVAPSIVVARIFLSCTLADGQLFFGQSVSLAWMECLGSSNVTSGKATSFPFKITGRHVVVMTAWQPNCYVSQTQITAKIQPHFPSIKISQRIWVNACIRRAHIIWMTYDGWPQKPAPATKLHTMRLE